MAGEDGKRGRGRGVVANGRSAGTKKIPKAKAKGRTKAKLASGAPLGSKGSYKSQRHALI